MKKSLFSLIFLFTAVPAIALADISGDDLPPDTVWYLHADLDAMRSTEAGRQLYGWLEEEVIVEVSDELGIDLGEEVDRITAFSSDGDSYVAIVEGRLSRDAQQTVLEITEQKEELARSEYRGKTYYYAGGADPERRGDIELERGPGYFTFAIPGKMIATSSEEALKALMDSNGKVAGAGSHADTLFVLSADKQFVQAGMRTAEFADDDDDWDSNILRNTEQAAMLISDQAGMIAIVAKLVSTDAKMTQSLASIVNGLIALQMFSSDIDPDVASILQNTKVNAVDRVLSVSTVLDPAVVVRTLGD